MGEETGREEGMKEDKMESRVGQEMEGVVSLTVNEEEEKEKVAGVG